MWNSMATKSSGQHTPNKLAGHQMMYIGASSGNTRQNIWLVTVASIAGNIGPEKYWEGARRKISTVCLPVFPSYRFVCVMLLLKGDR